MSLIQLPDVDNAPEQVALEKGEYQLRVISADYVESSGGKTGAGYIRLTFEALNEPNAQLINHIAMIPNSNVDEKTTGMWLRSLKELQEALDVSFAEGFETDDLVGKETWAILKVVEDDEYGRQNKVSRFVTGK